MGTHVRNGFISLAALVLALAVSGVMQGGAPQRPSAGGRNPGIRPAMRVGDHPAVGRPQTPPIPELTKLDKAYYLDPAAITFVRPGLIVKIVNATIAADGTIQAEVKITDLLGLPLDRQGITTPGPVSISFVPAFLPDNRTEYLDYATRPETANGRTVTQAAADSGGTWTQVGDGDYVYTFGTKANPIDPTATHSVGLYASRDLTDFDAGTQFSNDVFTWVPSGAPVTHVHDIISTMPCDQCHDPLQAHGGPRREVKLCVLCHTDQTSDAQSGNTLDFPVMIHKIHMGSDLPSVQAGTPYQIVGFGNVVHDFSNVVFPAVSPANCQMCHQASRQSTPVPVQVNAWATSPNQAACGACHDNVNFATGANHGGIVQISDQSCAQCHVASGTNEFDVSIMGAHTIPEFSGQLTGVSFTINNITNGAAGQHPTVNFTVKDKLGNVIPLANLNLLDLVLAYPTTDYQTAITESALKATANPDGTYTYAFTAVVPPGTTGTGSIGIEGYRNETINGFKNVPETVRDVGQNVVMDFSIDGSPIQPRRTVVTTQNCDQCHYHLEAHGTIRNEIAQCVLCHNPNATDADQRPADQNPPQGIAFKMMVHRIHTGADQQSPYIIFGFGHSVNSFTDIVFPGDRRDCEKCHVPGSQELPLPATELPVTNPRGFIDPQPPVTAACLGCHTDQGTAAHASLNTSPTLGEACVVCHGPNAQFSVDSVHAR